jgi:hypothetical protein
MANSWCIVPLTDEDFGHVLFESEAASGKDTNLATAVFVRNTGQSEMCVWCQGHHGQDVPRRTDGVLLTPGQAITFSVDACRNPKLSITKIVAWPLSGENPTSCTGGVVRRR